MASNQKTSATLNTFGPGAQAVFHLVLEDPSGNSFIEPLPELDYVEKTEFKRSAAQAEQLGLSAAQEQEIQREAKTVRVDDRVLDDIDVDTVNKVAELPGPCPACQKTLINKSVIIDIPYFRRCLLMAAKCDECGYKSVEIQPAGAISEVGRRYTLHVTDAADLSREVLKSNTCAVRLPEVGVELSPGTLGGAYTTLEGLLVMVRDALRRQSMFFLGDSARTESEAAAWTRVLGHLDRCISGAERFTVELDDPLDGSFIKNVFAPDPDPELRVETYRRSPEQDAEFGLDQIDPGE